MKLKETIKTFIMEHVSDETIFEKIKSHNPFVYSSGEKFNFKKGDVNRIQKLSIWVQGYEKKYDTYFLNIDFEFTTRVIDFNGEEEEWTTTTYDDHLGIYIKKFFIDLHQTYGMDALELTVPPSEGKFVPVIFTYRHGAFKEE